MGNNYDKSIHRMICGSVKKEKEIKTPDFYCESCEKRCGNRCTFYNRPIVKDYNRCFNHSNYSPIQAVFKAKEDLEKIIEEEQERLSA